MKKMSKTLNLPELKIPLLIRFSVILVMLIIIIVSFFTANAYYQEPTTSQIEIVDSVYHQNGKFDYSIYLINNTVYEKTVLKPGDGNFFKKIIDHINGSFFYNFISTDSSKISGSYRITAKIQTDLWDKTYTVVPTEYFNFTGQNGYFEQEFPIDYEFYDDVVKSIDTQTGVTSSNPQLLITCNVIIQGNTGENSVYDTFSQSMTISLNTKIIEFSEELSLRETQTFTKTQTVTNSEIYEQRNNWTIITIIFVIINSLFFVFTTNKIEHHDKVEKQLKQINKKYGEWVVETSQNNPSLKKNIIALKSMDDLQKVSEELGKPMVHYNSKTSNQHSYYILDDDIAYQYILKPEEKMKKIAICPQCKNEISIEGHPGSKIQIECNKCGKKGKISFDNPNEDKDSLEFLKKYFRRNNKIKN
jgi:hypothetical protein